MKHLMSGNEATARGVYEAGIKVCSAYPGTPSTRDSGESAPVRARTCTASGLPTRRSPPRWPTAPSVAGSRAFCTMKMVGLNVAADPLFTAGYMGVNGAYVVVTADDPSCHSSQNEQDNRHYARAAKIAMVEPSDRPGVQGLREAGLRDLRGVRYPRAVPHHHPRLSQQGPGGVRRARGARRPRLRPQRPQVRLRPRQRLPEPSPSWRSVW